MFSKKLKYYFFDLTADCCNLIIFFHVARNSCSFNTGIGGRKKITRVLLLESSRKIIWFLFPVTDFF